MDIITAGLSIGFTFGVGLGVSATVVSCIIWRFLRVLPYLDRGDD